jgi:hypothetical protein
MAREGPLDHAGPGQHWPARQEHRKIWQPQPRRVKAISMYQLGGDLTDAGQSRDWVLQVRNSSVTSIPIH